MGLKAFDRLSPRKRGFHQIFAGDCPGRDE